MDIVADRSEIGHCANSWCTVREMPAVQSRLSKEKSMPEVTLESLAQRVAALEESVAKLRPPQLRPPRTKDWRSTIGMFAGDELMKEVFEAGRAIREAEDGENQA